MISKVRAKFRCESVTEHDAGTGAAPQRAISLVPVYGKDGSANAEWSKWTPNGSCKLTITNPDVVGFFRPGGEYYLDFTPAEPPAETKPEVAS